MSKEDYRFYEIENSESIKNLEKLSQQGKIERAYPVTGAKTAMHLYKTDGFNISSYLHGEEASIEFSRYNNNAIKMDDKIEEIKELTGMVFKGN